MCNCKQTVVCRRRSMWVNISRAVVVGWVIHIYIYILCRWCVYICVTSNPLCFCLSCMRSSPHTYTPIIRGCEQELALVWRGKITTVWCTLWTGNRRGGGGVERVFSDITLSVVGGRHSHRNWLKYLRSLPTKPIPRIQRIQGEIGTGGDKSGWWRRRCSV